MLLYNYFYSGEMNRPIIEILDLINKSPEGIVGIKIDPFDELFNPQSFQQYVKEFQSHNSGLDCTGLMNENFELDPHGNLFYFSLWGKYKELSQTENFKKVLKNTPVYIFAKQYVPIEMKKS